MNLTDKSFNDLDAAASTLRPRWLEGPYCPHCGNATPKPLPAWRAKAPRGLYQCNECREPFTVTVGRHGA